MSMLATMSDEALIVYIRNTDHEAYREIIKRYQNKLYRYVFRLTNCHDDSIDILQNTFIKAYVNLYRFDAQRSFSAWIYRVAHNEAINYFRNHKANVDLSEIESLLKDNHDGPEEIFIKSEEKKVVEACLHQLPLKYREPILLYFLEEKSYEEISDILRIPVNTVGTLIHRAKKMLRQICKQEKTI